MDNKLELFNISSIQKYAVNDIIKYNYLTIKSGLMLTHQQAIELVETRNIELSNNGRIEFGKGVIGKIIYEFFDSPFITKYNYQETLHTLIEIFYYYKNETLDLLSDDDLIKYMRDYFNGVCHGSTDLLSGRELDRLARNIRSRRDADYSEDLDEEDE